MPAGLNEKSVWYPLRFSPRELPEGLFAEKNFSKVLPKLKVVTSTAFNLVLRLKSCSENVTDTPEAGFILSIPEAEDVAVVVIVKKEVRVRRVLLLTVFKNLRGKFENIQSAWKFEAGLRKLIIS